MEYIQFNLCVFTDNFCMFLSFKDTNRDGLGVERSLHKRRDSAPVVWIARGRFYDLKTLTKKAI